MGPILKREPVSIVTWVPIWVLDGVVSDRRGLWRSSARGSFRGVCFVPGYFVRRGVLRCGIAGEMGLSDGTTAHTLVLDFLGPRQVGGISWAKFLQMERPVDRDQGLGLASLNERTGSLNGLREMRSAQGWTGHPVRLMTQGLTSVGIATGRDSDAPHRKSSDGLRWVGRFVLHAIAVSSDDNRLPMMHQPVDQGRGQGVVHI